MLLAKWMLSGEVEFGVEKLRNPQVNFELRVYEEINSQF